MKFIDDRVPVFVIAPNATLAKDCMRMYADFDFSKRPNILTDRHDWERVQGLEKFHVIELISVRPWSMNEVRKAEYDFMVARVHERWNIIRHRVQSFGNMWIEFNLP